MGEQMGVGDEGRTNLEDLKTYQKMQRRSFYYFREHQEKKWEMNVLFNSNFDLKIIVESK